ncbi:calpain-8-like [Discoglossus pictus]
MSGVAAKVVKDRAAVAEGLGTLQNPVKYLDQDFEKLKTQCLASGTLFRDEHFPASFSSIGYRDLGINSLRTQGIVWKRPSEICNNPQFIVNGATRSDIHQGDLDNCWLLAAFASLALYKDILAQVVPQNQSFQDKYAGIFHFKFWQYGEWVDIVVDDRLPTKNKNLVFVHSEEGNEYWSALLEKAYAKLNGSYEGLNIGFTTEGSVDFTGGIAELFDLGKAPADLYQVIQKTLKADSLLGCGIKELPVLSTLNTKSSSNQVIIQNARNSITSKKLVRGHAYSVTGAEEVLFRDRKEKLIRLRNPWGKVEWTGPWSDEAQEWNQIDPKVRAALQKKSDDGEFWMAFSDFLKQYSILEICILSPGTLLCSEQHKWDVTLFNGSWIPGFNAGGCQERSATFWTNPQFRITLDEPDDDHVDSNQKASCTIIIGLMQKNRRKHRRIGEDFLRIGYSLYRIPSEDENHNQVKLGKTFFQTNQAVAHSDKDFMREVSTRLRLPVGEYLIVPYTFEPNTRGNFCLRVFSEKKSKSLEVGDVVKANPYEPQTSDNDVTTEFKDVFEKVAGKDKEMNANELQAFLNKLLEKRNDLKTNGFSLDTCRDMINLVDMDDTGTLGLQEFKVLWMKLQKYVEIYLKADTDHSGTMNANEIKSALQEAGFTLDNKIHQRIAKCYASSDLTIDFDSFISCMTRLETLFKMFQLLDVKKSGEIKLTLPEWIYSTLV